MDKEYGGLPAFMTGTDHPGNSGYLSRWEAISAQAEKEFHTTAPGVRSIIFPGDSRIIAVPVSGKPRVYDMDSDDPTERPAFEQHYGKLPACVPPAAPKWFGKDGPVAAQPAPLPARPEPRPFTDSVPHRRLDRP